MDEILSIVHRLSREGSVRVIFREGDQFTGKLKPVMNTAGTLKTTHANRLCWCITDKEGDALFFKADSVLRVIQLA